MLNTKISGLDSSAKLSKSASDKYSRFLEFKKLDSAFLLTKVCPDIAYCITVIIFQGNFNRDQAFGTSKHQPQFLDGNKKRYE
jgi:hypothetical protein